jgi:hypothetical protein
MPEVWEGKRPVHRPMSLCPPGCFIGRNGGKAVTAPKLKPVTMWAVLERRPWGWKISSFPRLALAGTRKQARAYARIARYFGETTCIVKVTIAEGEK